MEEKDGKGVLVRKHVLPRLALFNPLRATNCPVSLHEMTGERKTIVKPLHGGEAEINDTMDIQRNLQDRRFELQQQPLPPPKRQQVPDPKGDDAATPLTQMLRSSSCVAPGCDLPGGHLGHHRNNNEEFPYDQNDGSTKIIAEEKEPSTPSSSSTSSEELQPDLPGQDPKGDGKKSKDEFFMAVPINLDTSDWKGPAKPQHRRKADVWLSKKMSDRSKEVSWQKLPLHKKIRHRHGQGVVECHHLQGFETTIQRGAQIP